VFRADLEAMLVWQTLCTLSDDQTEYQLKDRLSFMRFIGLALHDRVPDAKMVWLFREQLARAGAIERLFARFDGLLRAKGRLAMGGQIRRRHGDRGAPAAVDPGREGDDQGRRHPRGVEAGAAGPDRPRRTLHAQAQQAARGATARAGHQRQPEIDAAVRLQKSCRHPDRENGLLRRYVVTDAAAYDGGQLGAVLDRDNTASDVWADTAYRSAVNLALLERRGLKPQFQRKKPRGRKMPVHFARGNATRARVRSRVEHVFAAQKCRLGLIGRTIGLVRPRAKIGLANLAYNFTRLAWLHGRTALA